MGGKRGGEKNPGRIRIEKKEKLLVGIDDDGQDDCLICWNWSESRGR